MRSFAALVLLVACQKEASQTQGLELALKCGQGDNKACDDGMKRNFKRCEDKDSQGCVLLGITYQAGHVVPKDLPEAAKWFQRACELGDGNGCWYYGSCFESGRGVAQDYVRARELFTKGCEGRETNACDSLGTLHQYGRGTPVDFAQAIAAYEKGCALGKGGFSCSKAEDLKKKR